VRSPKCPTGRCPQAQLFFQAASTAPFSKWLPEFVNVKVKANKYVPNLSCAAVPGKVLRGHAWPPRPGDRDGQPSPGLLSWLPVTGLWRGSEAQV